VGRLKGTDEFLGDYNKIDFLVFFLTLFDVDEDQVEDSNLEILDNLELMSLVLMVLLLQKFLGYVIVVHKEVLKVCLVNNDLKVSVG